MSWLTNFVRPKIRALVNKKDVPEHLWLKCPRCEAMLFQKDYEAAMRVCQHCGHHGRLGSRERLAMMFDDGHYETVELPKVPVDPLRFRDSKRYSERLRDTQAKTGMDDAILVGMARLAASEPWLRRLNFPLWADQWASPWAKALLRRRAWRGCSRPR